MKHLNRADRATRIAQESTERRAPAGGTARDDGRLAAFGRLATFKEKQATHGKRE
jgi:hypothetical protein